VKFSPVAYGNDSAAITAAWTGASTCVISRRVNSPSRRPSRSRLVCGQREVGWADRACGGGEGL